VSAVNVVRLSAETINSFRQAVDSVARERRWLGLTEAPALRAVAEFADMLTRAGAPQFVALDGKRVVGWCDIRPFNDSPSRAHVGVLGMGVLADYRGRGIGRDVLNACLAASPFTRVELSVFADNAPAIALYEKSGFVHEGVQRAALNLDGMKDLTLMARFDNEP
jgi:RimJ/RimL family protein N-acetyltransferase